MPRIDRVRLDQYYQQYHPQEGQVRRTEGETPFPLEPGERGVIYEPSGSTVKEPEGKAEEVSSRRNVSYATAAEAKEASTQKEETLGAVRAEEETRTVGELLRELGFRILSFLKGVWNNVWNGPEKSETFSSAEEASGEVAEAINAPTESLPETDPLAQIIAEHDLNQLVQYVTEYGTKKPARSTDLLTIYNRYGRVNPIDPSDRKKILEGNFHDIQL